MRVEFKVPGAPIPKKRPRFSTRGSFPVAYNPQRSEERAWRTEAKNALFGEMGTWLPLEKGIPVFLDVVFYMPIPKSTSKRKRSRMLGMPHVKKPDTDNLVKFVKDCLNGIAWHDDSQVWSIVAKKKYSAGIPYTLVVLEWEEVCGSIIN